MSPLFRDTDKKYCSITLQSHDRKASSSSFQDESCKMCAITIELWHTSHPERQRHLVHHRVDLCEYRKSSGNCDACRHAYGEVDPHRHESQCPFRRHNGRVCDKLSWWILEKAQDDRCPVCQENERIRETSAEEQKTTEVNAKCDIYRYCQTLCGGPCPFLMVVPDDCTMGWSPPEGIPNLNR
jgi:hypothetical protein